MRMNSSRLGACLVAVLAFIAVGALPIPAAHAGGGGNCYYDPLTGTEVCTGSDGNGGHNGKGGTSSTSCTTSSGSPIACSSGGASWLASRQCYAAMVTPQPPTTDPRWPVVPGGGAWTDSALYSCRALSGAVSYFASPVEVAILTDPAVVARAVRAAMRIRPFTIGMAPAPHSQGTFVGLPVWMWAQNPGPSTTGPITRSATQGGVMVTATATMTGTDWNMGGPGYSATPDYEGNVVHCTGAGAAYTASIGNQMSPSCGYKYSATSITATNNHAAFRVTATTHSVFKWAGGGRTGVITFDFVRTLPVVVDEIQVVVTH